MRRTLLTLALLALAGCASPVDDARPQAAAERLSRGEALMAQAAHGQAMAECQAGLAELGSSTSSGPICNERGHPVVVLDDSGHHAVLADLLQREGHLAEAARSACGALQARIGIARMARNTCRSRD